MFKWLLILVLVVMFGCATTPVDPVVENNLHAQRLMALCFADFAEAMTDYEEALTEEQTILNAINDAADAADRETGLQ